MMKYLVTLGCIMTLLSGCSVYQLTGDTMVNYSSEHMIPYLLERDDTAAVCATGLGLGQFLVSFGRVTDPPHKSQTVIQLSASTCAEQDAWRAEVDYLKALRRGDASGAVDASIAQKRAHTVTAKRLHLAYQGAVSAFGEPGEQCPELENEFDEMVWLLGMLAVVQGLQHDRAAEGAAGIPLDMPARAARGVVCLDNKRWWGVPQALKAAVWSSVPGLAPEKSDPWAELAAAVKIGDEAGVRLSRAIQLKALTSGGKNQEARAALKQYRALDSTFKRAPRWKGFDQIGRLQMLHMSDVIWVKETGHRTPFKGLGTFPEAEEEESSEAESDEGGLFDDLDDAGE